MYFVCNASALISPKAKNESVLRVKHWSCMTAGECFFKAQFLYFFWQQLFYFCLFFHLLVRRVAIKSSSDGSSS